MTNDNKHQKLIVFDLDGTLYDLNDVMSMSYQMQVDFFSSEMHMSVDEAKAFLTAKDVMPEVSKKSKSATELFLKNGIDKRKWSEYRNTHFMVSQIDKRKAVREDEIKNFKEIGIVVLLSSNAFSIIKKILDHIGIADYIFDEIICSDRFPYEVPFTKKLAMQYLSEKYQVAFSNMYSIGDRYSTDIKPILELGGNGILLHNPIAVSYVLKALEEGICTNGEEFDFYK